MARAGFTAPQAARHGRGALTRAPVLLKRLSQPLTRGRNGSPGAGRPTAASRDSRGLDQEKPDKLGRTPPRRSR